MKSFAQLFAGRTDVYGIYHVQEKRGDGKLKGKGDTKRDEVTEALYKQHLDGKIMLGIVPIRLDGTVSWFAGDIDVYEKVNLVEIDKKCQELEIPVVVCRSKSGGAHVYCFVDGAIKAADGIKLMRQWLTILGFPKSEIFPKQSEIDPDDFGSWINLPYFEQKKTNRYAIGVNGEKLGLEDFIKLAEARQIRPREVAGLIQDKKQKEQKNELDDAPPCIVKMIEEGVAEGGRNKALFHFGVYYRMMDPDGWVHRVITANVLYFDEGLKTDEVNTVIRNLSGPKYDYRCKEEPMCSLCNKELCLTRKWGVGPRRGINYSNLEVGGLTMLTSDPPVWIWEINGKFVNMTTDQITSPTKWRNRVIDVLGIYPMKVKASEHDMMVANAMESLKKEHAPDEVSLDGQVLETFKEWTANNIPRSRELKDVLKGLPFFIKEESTIVFRGQDFTQTFYRITKSNNTSRDIWAAMRKAGAKMDNKRIPAKELGSNNQLKLWHYPVDEPWFTIPGEEKF